MSGVTATDGSPSLVPIAYSPPSTSAQRWSATWSACRISNRPLPAARTKSVRQAARSVLAMRAPVSSVIAAHDAGTTGPAGGSADAAGVGPAAPAAGADVLGDAPGAPLAHAVSSSRRASTGDVRDGRMRKVPPCG
ncbi:hypothetical protein [Cellulomonas iranensis]|uniref:hypothetical protein n=1 Tax=Cellulomonas iranensis TaxID=76862 RepID=UPI000B3CBA0E|nr:hypothetical protein [Cellulomonas iranensis]